MALANEIRNLVYVAVTRVSIEAEMADDIADNLVHDIMFTIAVSFDREKILSDVPTFEKEGVKYLTVALYDRTDTAIRDMMVSEPDTNITAVVNRILYYGITGLNILSGISASILSGVSSTDDLPRKGE